MLIQSTQVIDVNRCDPSGRLAWLYQHHHNDEYCQNCLEMIHLNCCVIIWFMNRFNWVILSITSTIVMCFACPGIMSNMVHIELTELGCTDQYIVIITYLFTLLPQAHMPLMENNEYHYHIKESRSQNVLYAKNIHQNLHRKFHQSEPSIAHPPLSLYSARFWRILASALFLDGMRSTSEYRGNIWLLYSLVISGSSHETTYQFHHAISWLTSVFSSG